MVDQERSNRLIAIKKANRRMAIWAIVVLVIIIPVALGIVNQFNKGSVSDHPTTLNDIHNGTLNDIYNEQDHVAPSDSDDWGDNIIKFTGLLYFMGLPYLVYTVFENKASTLIGRVVLLPVLSIFIGWVLVFIAFYVMMLTDVLMFKILA